MAEEIDGIVVKVEADVSELLDDVDEAVKKSAKKLEEIPDAKINVDNTDAVKKFEQIKRTLSNSDYTDIDIKLRLDTTKGARELQDKVGEVSKSLSELDDPVQLKIDTADALRRTRSFVNQMDKMIDRIENVELRADTKDFVGQIKQGYQELEKAIGDKGDLLSTKDASASFGKFSLQIDGVMNKLKRAKAENEQSGGFFGTLKEGADGFKAGLGELQQGAGQFIQTFQGFKNGQASLSMLTQSAKGLAGTFGKLAVAGGAWTAGITAGAGAAIMAISKVKDQLTDATAQVRQILNFQTITNTQGSGIRNVAGGFETASSFEKYETQFKTLLKSQENAQARIAEYAEFGVKTPYNLPEIVEAGKLLQTFGGTALATGDNLTMVGDTASSVGATFSEMSFWIGRAYTSMKAGRPWGEAAMRLQELAVLSGTERQELEAMAKQGKTGMEVWEAFTRTLGKFSGGMDNLSKTMEGMQSNLEDFQEQVALQGGQQVFDAEKMGLTTLLEYLNENEQTYYNISTLFGMLAAQGKEYAYEWRDAFLQAFPIENIQELLQWVNTLAQEVFGLRRGFGEMTIPTMLGEALGKAVKWLSMMVERQANFIKGAKIVTQSIMGWLKPIGQMAVGLAEAFGSVVMWLAQIHPAISAISDSSEAIEERYGGIKEALTSAMITFLQLLAMSEAGWKGFIKAIEPTIEWLGAQFEVLKARGEQFWAVLTFDQDKADKAKADAEKWAKEANEAVAKGFYDEEAGRQESAKWLQMRAEAISELEQGVEPIEVPIKLVPEENPPEIDPQLEEFKARLAKAQEFQDRFIKIEQNHQKNLDELEKDRTKKMEDMAENRQEKLEDMEEKYLERLEDMEENYTRNRTQTIEDHEHQTSRIQRDRHIKQERAEEDFQRRMKQMQEKYLEDLSEAVKNRDARAIIRLQKNYKKQVDQAQEGESTRRKRESEDNAKADSDRQQDFERRLQKMDENYERQKVKAAENYQKQQEELDKNLAKQQEKLDESHQERIDELNKSLEKELESMSIAMVDMADITEEGARHILETFNDTFGIGGDIDELMQDFAKRRSMQGSFSFEIEQSFQTDQQKSDTAKSQASSSAYNDMISQEDEQYMSEYERNQRSQSSAQTSSQSVGSNVAGQIANKYGLSTTDVRRFINKALNSNIKLSGLVDFAEGTEKNIARAIVNYGGVPGLATGGMFLANKPTLLTVGERGAEVVSASPVNQLDKMRNSFGIGASSQSSVSLSGDLRVSLDISGNTNGIDQSHFEQAVSTVLVDALTRSGVTDRNIYKNQKIKV